MKKRKIHTYRSFDPRSYLNHYYVRMGDENVQIVRFLHNVLLKDGREFQNALDFGCGPTIYPGLVMSSHVKHMVFSDYLKANRDEVNQWISKHEEKFSWDLFTRYILAMEQGCSTDAITQTDIERREDELRKKTAAVVESDIFFENPMGKKYSQYFDLLVSNFVIDSVTDSKKSWAQLFSNLVSMIKPGGRLVMSAIIGAKHYRIGSKHFVAVNVTADDIRNKLIELGFGRESLIELTIDAEVKDRYHELHEGYDGMFFLSAVKS